MVLQRGAKLESTKSKQKQENHETNPSSPVRAFLRSSIVAMNGGRLFQSIDIRGKNDLE